MAWKTTTCLCLSLWVVSCASGGGGVEGNADADADPDRDASVDDGGGEDGGGRGCVVESELDWRVEDVGPEPTDGEEISIDVDAAGAVHSSYRVWLDNDDVELRYARKSGSGWIVETVDTEDEPGYWDTSLRVGPAGEVHVVYQANGTDELRHAVRTDDRWSIERIAEYGSAHPALALDSGGVPHVTTNEGIGDIVLRTKSNGAWRSEILDTWCTINGSTQVAITRSDVVHVAYRCSSVRHAVKNHSSWDSTVVDRLDPWGLVMAVDGTGAAHIVYEADHDVRYATNASGDWAVETAHHGEGGYPAMALDEAGWVHVAFRDENEEEDTLVCLHRVDGTWRRQIVDTGHQVGWDAALAIGGGSIHAVYNRGGRLRHAWAECR